MTDVARAKLLARLVRVAAIAFYVAGKARFDAPALEPVTDIAARRAFHLAAHLLRVHVVAVRESLYPKLIETIRKCRQHASRINRLGVADNAELALFGREILPVTFYAGGVAGKYGCRIVRRAP